MAFQPAPWGPGDKTLYDVTTRNGNQPAGTASFTLGREFDTDTLSALLQIGTTQDRYVMGWTTATFAPISELRSIVTPDGTIDISAEFHEGGCTIQVIDRTGTNVRRLNSPPKYYANDQFLMILRALPFKEGYQGSLVTVPSMGDPATLNSVVTVTGTGHVSVPEPPLQVNDTTASVRCQPAGFGAGVTVAEIDGPVLTIFTVTLAVALLPARSTAVPMTVCVPAAVTTIGGVHESMPDPASAHVNVTVASPSMVPSAFGAGVTAAVIVGFVLSMLTVTDVLFVLPARSVAVPCTT